MAQHDYVIDNGPGLAVRTDMNAALAAIVSQNSGPTEPTTMYAYMIWMDTSVSPNGQLRQRNSANSAWMFPQFNAVAFGAADMSIIQKTAPARIVINDKADGTGSDVFTFHDDGTITGVKPNTNQTFLSTAAWTKPAGAMKMRIKGGGAGGGGGGAAGAASGSASGAGGEGGACGSTPWIDISAVGVTGGNVTIGAAGAAGAAAAGFGGNGGDTIVTITSLATLTFEGGAGGVGITAATTPTLAGPSTRAAVTTTDAVNAPIFGGSQHGAMGTRGLNGHGGWGGGSPFGTGGFGGTPNATGATGNGYCAGGAGGSTANTSNVSGGPGRAGIVFFEFAYY